MGDNNSLKGKLNTIRPATSNVNPLLRAAVAGFPFESDQSPIFVPVCLNENPSAGKL